MLDSAPDPLEARRQAAFAATAEFEAARRVFLQACRVYLRTREIDLQMRWQQVVGTIAQIRGLWHMAEGGNAPRQ